MKGRFRGLRWVTVTALIVPLFALLPVTPAGAVTGAVSTTDNAGHLDTYDSYVNQACLNGQGVNCNIYLDKRDVWLSGLPVSAALGAGTYFFAVLSPGGQPAPNDGGTNNSNGELANLSDNFDDWTDREFTVDGDGNVTSYPGDHDRDGSLIQLFPYEDTPNNGGVYILAVCAVPDDATDPPGGPGVNPSDCKYDAFKVKESEAPGAQAPTILKDAEGTNDRSFIWTIEKDVDKTEVKQVGGSATFNYTITVSHDGGTVSNVKVTGTIDVFNPNSADITGANVTDKLSDNTVCAVTGGSNVDLSPGDNQFAYSCDLSGLPQGELDNTAKVTWPDQTVDGSDLVGDSAEFTFTNITFTENQIDECIDVTDSYAGDLGTVCVGDANPTELKYSRTIAVVEGCVEYDNTATFTTNDTGTQGSASQTVTVCGPSRTSALTIGFWKTTNGQNLIKTYSCPNGKTSLADYLKGLGPTDQGPFADASGCGNTMTSYVSNILKGATATNMNIMLRAQMLGTALDVYFSDPAMGYTSTSISKVKPPSVFLTHGTLGGFNMDLTAICPMVDNTSTGTASCKNNTPSTDGFTSGAFPSACMTVQAILDYESTLPPFNGSTSSPNWYAGNRIKEEIAKNTFDQINNQDAFAC
jgi:hypothetical protein